jgi:hypothetical protein
MDKNYFYSVYHVFSIERGCKDCGERDIVVTFEIDVYGVHDVL